MSLDNNTWAFSTDPAQKDQIVPYGGGSTVSITYVKRLRVALQRMNTVQRRTLQEAFNIYHRHGNQSNLEDSGTLLCWLGEIETILLEKNAPRDNGPIHTRGRRIGRTHDGSVLSRPPRRYEHSYLALRNAVSILGEGVEDFTYFCCQEELPMLPDTSEPLTEEEYTCTVWAIGFQWTNPPQKGNLLEHGERGGYVDDRSQEQKDWEQARLDAVAAEIAQMRAAAAAEAT